MSWPKFGTLPTELFADVTRQFPGRIRYVGCGRWLIAWRVREHDHAEGGDGA